jgi:hypothetical protein
MEVNMSESSELRTNFAGTYFERDKILQISRIAGIFAWILLVIYLLTTLISFTQFMIQFSTGLFYQKGMAGVDVLGFFTPYLLQPVPGLIYFAGLKFMQHTLLILLDIEDNTRRAARNK